MPEAIGSYYLSLGLLLSMSFDAGPQQ